MTVFPKAQLFRPENVTDLGDFETFNYMGQVLRVGPGLTCTKGIPDLLKFVTVFLKVLLSMLSIKPINESSSTRHLQLDYS